VSKRKSSLPEPAWTKFERAYLSSGQESDILALKDDLPDEIWKNSRFEVWVYLRAPMSVGVTDQNFPVMTHLSIKRRDKQVVRRWRDLQRIKNEIMGPEREAVELFPSERRLVDTANQYHLFVLPEGLAWPFGYRDRMVIARSSRGATQEPFEPGEEPVDAIQGIPDDLEEAKRFLKDRYDGKKVAGG